MAVRARREEAAPLPELPVDALISIFGRLSIIDKIHAGETIRCWRMICRNEPELWRVIDLTHNQGYQLIYLRRFLILAIDRSRGQAFDIRFSGNLNARCFRLLANRCPRLRRLWLRGDLTLGYHEFEQAIQMLPLLEEVRLYEFYDSPANIFEALGVHCPNLVTFGFNLVIENEEVNEIANQIALWLPRLHHIQLVRDRLDNQGVRTILDRCPNLESLDLRGCINVQLAGDLEDRCGQLVDFKGPNAPMEDFPFQVDDDDEVEGNDEDED